MRTSKESRARYRAANKEKIAAYRAAHKEEAKACNAAYLRSPAGKASKARYRASEKGKATRARSMKKYRATPVVRKRVSARNKARYHLPMQPCEACGVSPAERHHDNYDKPLEVRFLCRAHHLEHHAQAK